MTTIAWDGKTLAADRGAWSSNFRYRARKVFRETGPDNRVYLVGFVGKAETAELVLQWMRGGEKPVNVEEMADKTMIAIIIDDDRHIWRLGPRLVYTRVYQSMHSFGMGQEGAMCAMLAGASAKRAIEIVAMCTDASAFGVDTVTF